jgi:uncharacterized protein (DUF1501 family)
MQRNRFLLGALSGLAVAARADTFFGRALAASAPPDAADPAAERVLVVVNLQGGNDGLNTIVPHSLEAYYRARPTLAIAPSDVLRIDERIGFNPALASLKTLYDAGNVAIVQGAGYPHPDHSHFRSTEIWQTAAPGRYERTGWLGRYLDSAQLPAANLFSAVAIAPVVPEALLAQRVDVPAISDLRGYGLRSDRNAAQRSTLQALIADERVPFSSPYLATLAEIEAHAQRGSEELPKLLEGYTTDTAYPATPLGRSLALAARMIGSRLGTRVIYVQHGSFDTHAAQRATQDRLLRELSEALAAFTADLAAHGNDRRTLTMTFSEFGRRVAENASRGTDHGEAGPMFVVGAGVKGGLYGAHPSLDVLDAGDITYTTDFRSVYATVVERWFERPSREIAGGTFERLSFLG